MYYYFLLFLPSWVLYHFIEYCLHTLSHNHKYGGYIYNIHKKHHLIHYPVAKLIAPPPYKTNYYYFYISEGLIAQGPPFLIVCLLFYFMIDSYTSFIIISQLLLFAYISDYIHTEIHTFGSWLEKYEWFIHRRNSHFIHHKKHRKNINIIDYTFDKLNNTYYL